MVALTASEIAQTTRGRLVSGDPARRVERWSIDSRTIARGDLFVAVHGERFDGHAFVAAALDAGAAGAVVTTRASATPE
ncbi:MAG: Mur ligase domain-containing protein, partial [Vicinamibacterales bacterium]